MSARASRWSRSTGLPPVTLGAGGIAILPRNDPHLLASRIGLPPADVGDIGWVTAPAVPPGRGGSDGPAAEVWCGFLGTATHEHAHPLLDALPALLTLDVVGRRRQWLDRSMRFLAEQPPRRKWSRGSPSFSWRRRSANMSNGCRPGAKGWLRGLADPAVSKALSIIHIAMPKT